MTRDQAEREISRLRSEAHYAYLDGRTNRAKELNRKADLVESPWRAERLLTAAERSLPAEFERNWNAKFDLRRT